ncbi:cysteine-rich protein 1 isoform X1 [Camelus ferus]|uniref:Cysteine-rich protein 1 isoform X1 n=2 Tax=Camelus TaxID=9836 RepID=A0A8B8TA51_CAMFR|nr:cysteine-rich protein 1 isoform X1 [Camelus dromedarius]XP_031531553.1 cysteine-rich protein 1 isoform X1 [Vicugna pacos]XP_032338763.1 cysteine-rich protein 1 isoform X1 [Camelus ferus]XP_045361669.1 cysteine-rich protein 1 [Camelus bactrianus]
MPKCPKCDKEVYFGERPQLPPAPARPVVFGAAPRGSAAQGSPAERVTSLGKDWHRPCLKCEKCGKTLTSGGHAEHEGKPYCNHPCYAAMFGPKGFGRGGAESHTFK